MIFLIQYAIDFTFVISLAVVGLWLETVNGKHGFIDEFLAPFPLAIGGLMFVGFWGFG